MRILDKKRAQERMRHTHEENNKQAEPFTVGKFYYTSARGHSMLAFIEIQFIP